MLRGEWGRKGKIKKIIGLITNDRINMRKEGGSDTEELFDSRRRKGFIID